MYTKYEDTIIMCKEKKCTNCQYFNVFDKEQYRDMGVGFCTCYSVSYDKSVNHIAHNICCEFWEAGENNRNAEMMHIENVLIDMQEKLTKIARILEEEKSHL